ncbi:MAG: hypothetical protein H6559_34365 [Lewinellaceae bacterium]|nr:hypothetical protein [Lewinellaceae bacterium]
MEQAIEAADPEADAEVVKLVKRNGAIAAYYVGNDQRKSDDFETALATYDKGIAFSPGFLRQLYQYRAQALEEAWAKSQNRYPPTSMPEMSALNPRKRIRRKKCTAKPKTSLP